MKQLIAFTKKEFMEQTRSGRMIILTIIFCLFGIMNPAIAKLTPWMMDLLSEELQKNGMTVAQVNVDALTSWTQFYKNIPIALIIFLVMFGGILTHEYQKGTLINMITKGLNRYKIILSKTITMIVLWTLGFLLSYGITYGYNSYFWNNSIAKNLFFASFCLYLFGLWLITIIPLASTMFSSTSAILLSVGAAYLIAYLLSLLPALKEFTPTYLFNSAGLLAGTSSISSYATAIIITLLLMFFNLIMSMLMFNKKNL